MTHRPRIHIVYPHGHRRQPPHRIGTELARALSATHEVVQYEWDSMSRISPNPGDTLVAHLHNWPWTIARRSWADPRWGRRIVLQPFNADLLQNAFLDPYVMTADGFLAISGPSWVETMAFGPFRHWESRTTQLDLGIDIDQYPFIKETASAWGPTPSFLYVGSTHFSKRPEFLEELALALPEIRFGQIGGGRRLRGFTNYGYIDTASNEARRIVGEYSHLLMLSRADANPTAVLEAMAWGLIPVLAPSCGYTSEDGVHIIPSASVREAIDSTREIVQLDPSDEYDRRRKNRRRVEHRFTWDHFANRACATILDTRKPPPPPPGTLLARDRMILRAAALASPNLSSLRAARNAIRVSRREWVSVLRS